MLFEGADGVGDLGVVLDELLDVLLVLGGALFEVADGQGQVRELREGGEQRRGCGRVAGVGHVERDGTQQRQPAHASLPHADLHEGRQGRGELHVVRDRGPTRGQQGGVGRLHVHGGRARMGDAGGNAVQREGDLDARALADAADRVGERLPVGVRFRAMQDQDRVTHIVFDQVENGLGHHHVRGGHPVLDGDNRPVGSVVHERVGVKGRDALVVQRAQHLPDGHAPGPTGVDRPVEVDEEDLGLCARGGAILVKVGRVNAHVSSSCSIFFVVSNVPARHPPRHPGTPFELGAKRAS